MDEVFGEKNLVAQIAYAKTTGFSGMYLSSVCDYLVWYAKDLTQLKYRALYDRKEGGSSGRLWSVKVPCRLVDSGSSLVLR